MKNDILLPCTLLEVKRDVPWEVDGKKGTSASLLVRLGTVVVRVKADNSKVDFLSACEKQLDSQVVLLCTAVAGNNLALVLRAVDFAPKK